MHKWQIEEIKKGIAEAEAGDFASVEQVQAVLAEFYGQTKSALLTESAFDLS